jgi:transcription antitermination factor NusG
VEQITVIPTGRRARVRLTPELDYRRPVVETGDQWVVYKVPPRKEAAAQMILKSMGYKVWIPSQKRYLRRTRSRKKGVEVFYPSCPGYIYVAFRDRAPWADLFRLNLLKLVMLNDLPVVIAQDAIAAIESDNPNAYTGLMSFKVGESRSIEAGPFRGFQSNIMEISHEEAEMLVTIFNRECKVRVRLSDLGPVIAPSKDMV